jgi:hypothetical protein
MIWFDLKEMETRLAKDDISEKESLNYYLAIFIATSILLLITSVIAKNHKTQIQENNWQVILSTIINIVISIIGIIGAYRINEQFDNKDFFKRFFPLSFVIFIRLTVYIICLSIPIFVILGLFISLTKNNNNYSFLYGYLYFIVKIIFYGLIILSFKRVIKEKNQLSK